MAQAAAGYTACMACGGCVELYGLVDMTVHLNTSLTCPASRTPRCCLRRHCRAWLATVAGRVLLTCGRSAYHQQHCVPVCVYAAAVAAPVLLVLLLLVAVAAIR